MRPYTKLNSQGNDFILTESDTTMPDISVANVIKYSSRDNIGCDQFFIIDTTDKKKYILRSIQSGWLKSMPVWKWTKSYNVISK